MALFNFTVSLACANPFFGDLALVWRLLLFVGIILFVSVWFVLMNYLLEEKK